MPRYEPPHCAAPDEEFGGRCGVAMKPLGERAPSFGPNWKPGHWVFQCPRCGAIRAISDAYTERYVSRV